MTGFTLGVRETIAACTLLTLVLRASGHEISDSTEVSYERNIYKYVMDYYTPSVRPVRKDSDILDVELDLYIYSIEDVDEVNQAFRASGWLYMKWNDFQLSWQPEEFGNVSKTRVPISKLWFPDVSVMNSLDDEKLMPNTLQLAVLHSNGDVYWFPSMNFRTFCPLDLTHFPFDEHTCNIRIITWTYNGLEINITTMFETPSQRFVESSEWELVRTQNVVHRAYYACCEEPYIDLEFRMQLRRRPTFASHLFVAPSIILCLVTPTVFALPPASFEKLTLGTGILISHVLLLGELIGFVPSAHPTVPLIGKFFLANIVMVSLSLAISVVVLNLWSRSRTRRVAPPSFCRTILLNAVVMKVLLIDLDDYDDDDDDDGGLHATTLSAGAGGSELQSGKLEVMADIAVDSVTDDRVRIIDKSVRAAAKADWRRLAVVVDRFFFVVFAVIMIVTCLAFTGYM